MRLSAKVGGLPVGAFFVQCCQPERERVSSARSEKVVAVFLVAPSRFESIVPAFVLVCDGLGGDVETLLFEEILDALDFGVVEFESC